MQKQTQQKLGNSAQTAGLKAWIKPIVNPAQYDFWCREFGSTAAWHRCFARVLHIRSEAKDTKTITLKPNRNFGGNKAGQHINVSAEINGRVITRCYSISSGMHGNGTLDITVKHDKKGLVSNWLHSALQVGDVLELGQAFGGLTVEYSTQPVLMLAAGSGITPMMSLLEGQVKAGFPLPVTLLYWERGAEQFCFSSNLKTMEHLYANFTVHFIDTSVNFNGDVKSGRISAKQLKALATEAEKSQVLACGGAAFVDEAKRLIGDDSRFQAEAFSPAIVPVTDERKQNFTVELQKSGRSITVSNQEPLLVALENQGVAVQSGCRMGICNSCICDVKQGSTKDINSGVQNKADGAVKLCVSRASSALQLDL